MADMQDDTFSSDNEPNTYANTKIPKTSFLAPDNSLVEAPAEYDPKTGENLTISRISKLAPELKPVIMMQAPDSDTPISVPYDKLHFAISKGLKPFEQIQNENAANVAKQSIKEGNLGMFGEYNPTENESFKGGLARGLSSNIEPQVVGAVKGVANLAKGGDYLPAYREGRDIEESANTGLKEVNPKSYVGGELLGNTAQFALGNEAELGSVASKIPFGSFGRNIAGGTALGAASGAAESANKGQDISDIAENSAKNAGIGGAGAGLGYGAGKLVGLAGEGISGLANKAITPEAKSSFQAALKGKDFNNPQVQKEVLDTAANYTGDLKNTIDEVRKLVGKQKETHLNSIGDISHDQINSSLENAYNKLDFLESKTGDDEVLNAIKQGKSKIIGAMSTLEKNPNSAVAIDIVKRDLAAPIYDTKGNFVSKSGTTNVHGISSILEDARKSAQEIIESHLPDKIKGTNQAYKDILEAQHPQEAYDKVIPDLSQTDALIKGNKSLSIRKRLNNLEDFNKDIQNNPEISSDIKTKLNNIIDKYDDVIHDASIVNKISNASGIKPWTPENQTALGAKLGTKLAPQNSEFGQSTQKTAQFINGVAKDYFDKQPPHIQKLIRTSPDFVKKLLQAIPVASGLDVNTIDRENK